jgi:chemotaxis protein CheD
LNQIVSVADLKVSSRRGDAIITHALGSCLGITAHDPVARVGGLLHAMLPDSSVDPGKALEHPCMFVDAGVLRLFEECLKAGAEKSRVMVRAAGGATSQGDHAGEIFQIGRRNFVMLRRVLFNNGIPLEAYDVGGTDCRNMRLDVDTGDVLLVAAGVNRALRVREPYPWVNVLIVDPNPTQRGMIRTAVECGLPAGSIMEAGGAGEVLRALSSEPVDLLILDLDGGGREAWKGTGPALKGHGAPAVIFLSSRPGDVPRGAGRDPQPGAEPVRTAVLAKPFTADLLRDKVVEVTGASVQESA